MRRRALSWVAVGCAAAVFLPRADATEADALAISANIQAVHLPYGTMLDPIYAAPNSSQIVDYTRCGDSAIWTGHYLAAEAFRYNVTGSADALNNVQTGGRRDQQSDPGDRNEPAGALPGSAQFALRRQHPEPGGRQRNLHQQLGRRTSGWATPRAISTWAWPSAWPWLTTW